MDAGPLSYSGRTVLALKKVSNHDPRNLRHCRQPCHLWVREDRLLVPHCAGMSTLYCTARIQIASVVLAAALDQSLADGDASRHAVGGPGWSVARLDSSRHVPITKLGHLHPTSQADSCMMFEDHPALLQTYLARDKRGTEGWRWWFFSACSTAVLIPLSWSIHRRDARRSITVVQGNAAHQRLEALILVKLLNPVYREVQTWRQDLTKKSLYSRSRESVPAREDRLGRGRHSPWTGTHPSG